MSEEDSAADGCRCRTDLERIQSYDGVLPFNDKADPDTIKAEFGYEQGCNLSVPSEDC